MGWESTGFTGVCVFTLRSREGGVPQSRVISQASDPRSFLAGIPQCRTGGTIWPGLGYTNVQDRTGVPHSGTGIPPGWDWDIPPPPRKKKQQSEHLLCGGRYASCGYAGWLSCCCDSFTSRALILVCLLFFRMTWCTITKN